MDAVRVALLTMVMLLCGVAPYRVDAQDYAMRDGVYSSVEVVNDTVVAYVHFPLGKQTVDPKFNGNGPNLKHFHERINKVINQKGSSIFWAHVTGESSPEGPREINERLSQLRGHNIVSYLGLDSLERGGRFSVSNHVNKWNAIEKPIRESNWAYKDKALEIIGSNISESAKEARLRALGPAAWSDILKDFMTPLRSAELTITVRRVRPFFEFYYEDDGEIEIEDEPLELDEVPFQPLEDNLGVPAKMRCRVERNGHFAIKNNLLYDIATVANIGFEIGYGRFSIDVPGYYSPYTIVRPYTMRHFGIQPEFRLWFAGKPMEKGHFFGAHALVDGFNVQVGDKYRYQDPNRAAWGAGLSYGYVTPLNKNGHWTMEFTIGGGYANIKYDVYEGQKNGRYLYTETKDYWGITKLGITFAYKFDFGSKKKD